MRIRLGVVVATACVLASSVATGAEPAVKPPANEDCLACHGDAAVKRANGSPVFVADKVLAGSTHAPLACVDCHSDLTALTEYPHPEKLAKVNCASCHDAEGTTYHDSIHYKAREQMGLVVAPSCADCHGRHDIQPKSAPSSRVARRNIPATCGSCHQGITEKYDAGIHAAALRKGDTRAPICADCHTAHGVQRVDNESWRLGVARECGTCHMEVVESFTRTFHGKVTQLGFTRVAACADCHGAHDILPRSNPASMVAAGHLVKTCAKCHPGANANFVKYDPHPNPRNRQRNPALWWISQFYIVLIAGCFGFFGLHSLLWFHRERRERMARRQRSSR
jgi:hypothetical protein